jgi:hypothetical protein
MAYQKDFLLMAMDNHTAYPCIFPECSFKGCQNDLDRHVHEECDYRVIFCREKKCKKTVLAKDLERHKWEDCIGFDVCLECHALFRSSQIRQHLEEEHSYKECNFCNISYSQIQEHEHKCVYRPVQCKFCNMIVYLNDSINHLDQHKMMTMACIKENEENILFLSQEIERQNVQITNLQQDLLMIEMCQKSCMESI